MLIAVIPCHNEAGTLGPVARRAGDFGLVLVIDDRSTDASAEVARAACAEVIASRAPGYDGAIHTGLEAAFARGATQVITLDADGEHDPALIGAFAAALSNGAELVCGVRRKPQRASEYIAAALGRLILGVRDPLCGMKGYARPAIARYLESGAPLHLNMTPMVLSRRAGAPFAQVAVTGETRVGRPRFGRALKANLTILGAVFAIVKLKGRAA